jgi:hypothetical protein
VSPFILLTDIGDQHFRALHLDFEGRNQRIFRVNDNVFRFSLKFKADRKLHLRSPPNYRMAPCSRLTTSAKSNNLGQQITKPQRPKRRLGLGTFFGLRQTPDPPGRQS